MLSWLGIVTIIVFMALIVSKRLHVITALIIIPVIAAVIGGFTPKLGPMMLDGLKTVSVTGIMIVFSVLFWGTLLDTGFFNPVIDIITRTVKNDPVKIAIGTVLMTLTVALDGDGTTTFMIVTLSMLPVYKRVGMNPLILTCLATLSHYIMNNSPWGGPTTRTMAVLQLGVAEIFTPMVPSLFIGAIWVIFVAYLLGKKERTRLGYAPASARNTATVRIDAAALLEQDTTLLRPNLIWVNLAIVVAVMFCLMKDLMPPSILFIIGFALVILVNYRSFEEIEGRIRSHSGNALWATVMIFAAGIFTGIFKGTKMIDAMAVTMVSVIPDVLGPHMALLTAIASNMLCVVISPDAYYFGVLPIISQAAAHFGIDPAAIGRAALFGQIGYAASPLVGAPLLLCSLANVQFFEHQRFVYKWALLTTIVITVSSIFLGITPL